MDGNIFEALKLMIIGMSTVFCVLVLVIALGNAIIRLVNKFAPEEAKPAAAATPAAAVSPSVAAAIAKAVSMVTGGKGVPEKIERI